MLVSRSLDEIWFDFPIFSEHPVLYTLEVGQKLAVLCWPADVVERA